MKLALIEKTVYNYNEKKYNNLPQSADSPGRRLNSAFKAGIQF